MITETPFYKVSRNKMRGYIKYSQVNGLWRCILRLRNRIYFREDIFLEWLDERREIEKGR
jgi:hypothetical protein